MADTIAPAVPAGWYDDPADPAAYRWWSGVEWTAHVSPKHAPPVAPAPAAPAPATAPPGSPQTLGVWLLAFLPLMGLVVSAISFLALAASGIPALGYVGTPIALALAWLFAVLDRRALRDRGFPVPSVWWMLLLPPLAYLIARGRAVRSVGGRAWPAEAVYVGTLVILGGTAMTISALAVYTAQHPATSLAATGQSQDLYLAGTFDVHATPDRAEVEDMLAVALMADRSIVVDCSGATIVRGSTFTCDAWDTVTPMQWTLGVEFCDCGDVFYSVTELPGSELATGEHGVGNGLMTPQSMPAGPIPDEGRPWQPQVEEQLRDAGGYTAVDCSASADLIDKRSTFDCSADRYDSPVRLSVTISEMGEIAFTEYDGTAPAPEDSVDTGSQPV